MSVSVAAPDASFASLRSFSSMCRVFFIQMIMPYLYGRNNQHRLNSVSRTLHKRISRGRSIHNFRLPELRQRFDDHRRAFDTLGTGIEDPPVIVKIIGHLGLPTRAPPRAWASRVDLFQTI